MNEKGLRKNEETGFIKKHGKKILVAAGACVVAGVSYTVYKREVNLHNTITALEEAKHTLMAACSENLFEEAIATTTRKLNFRQLRLESLTERLELIPGDSQTLNARETIINEIDILTKRLEAFNDAQRLYEISALEE